MSLVVDSLSPTRGSLAGGTKITINGKGEREKDRAYSCLTYQSCSLLTITVLNKHFNMYVYNNPHESGLTNFM